MQGNSLSTEPSLTESDRNYTIHTFDEKIIRWKGFYSLGPEQRSYGKLFLRLHDETQLSKFTPSGSPKKIREYLKPNESYVFWGYWKTLNSKINDGTIRLLFRVTKLRTEGRISVISKDWIQRRSERFQNAPSHFWTNCYWIWFLMARSP